MSKVLKILARKILFGPQPARELPSDPLPGLDPPRMLPKPPVAYDFEHACKRTPSVEEIYADFKVSESAKIPSKPHGDEDWLSRLSNL